MTGAGISCSGGIPVCTFEIRKKLADCFQDFRSSGGLYEQVKKQYPEARFTGSELFNIHVFDDPISTSAHLKFIAQLKMLCDNAAPSATHKFIKTLDVKGKLLRLYSQNIDGLEERAGLMDATTVGSEPKSVLLHGDLREVTCRKCAHRMPFTEEIGNLFNRGRAPDCIRCEGLQFQCHL